MHAHGLPGRLWIAAHNCVEDALVVELAALRAARHLEDALALLAQQVDDRVNQRGNERVLL